MGRLQALWTLLGVWISMKLAKWYCGVCFWSDVNLVAVFDKKTNENKTREWSSRFRYSSAFRWSWDPFFKLEIQDVKCFKAINISNPQTCHYCETSLLAAACFARRVQRKVVFLARDLPPGTELLFYFHMPGREHPVKVLEDREHLESFKDEWITFEVSIHH